MNKVPHRTAETGFPCALCGVRSDLDCKHRKGVAAIRLKPEEPGPSDPRSRPTSNAFQGLAFHPGKKAKLKARAQRLFK